MAKYANGVKSLAISDRSGQAFPYGEMVTEWNGSFVHISEYEPKHPQLEPPSVGPDPQALHDPRPDQRTEVSVAVLLGVDPFLSGSSGSAVITVIEPSHGRSSSDTVRFRKVEAFDGFTEAVLEKSDGYSITVVDGDTYTFSASSGTATSGSTRGGGENATVGPVTLES